jgi:hypothetical protein
VVLPIGNDSQKTSDSLPITITMTKLSYDDGVTWSTVVLTDGLWLEVRRGYLTGKASQDIADRVAF